MKAVYITLGFVFVAAIGYALYIILTKTNSMINRNKGEK